VSPVTMIFTKHAGLRPLILATVCAMLLPRAVSAQPVTVRPKAADTNPKTVEAQARRHFQQGREFLDANAYAEAITEFETALSLMPLPELLFNIAQAYRLKGDAKHALQMYTRFVEVVPDGPVADEARAHIAALTKEISEAEQEADATAAARRQHEAEREERARQRGRRCSPPRPHTRWHQCRDVPLVLPRPCLRGRMPVQPVCMRHGEHQRRHADKELPPRRGCSRGLPAGVDEDVRQAVK